MKHSILRVVAVERKGVIDRPVALAAAALLQFPEAERVPRRAIPRRELERAILNEFGVETTVSRVVEVFEEDAKQIRTNRHPGRARIDVQPHRLRRDTALMSRAAEKHGEKEKH